MIVWVATVGLESISVAHATYAGTRKWLMKIPRSTQIRIKRNLS